MRNKIKENSTNYANKTVLSDRCHVNDTLSLIGKRWMMTILYEISRGKNQFTALRKDIPEISQQVLAVRIADLTEHELITKEEKENTVPLQISYKITVKGKQLLLLVDGLEKWNRAWIK